MGKSLWETARRRIVDEMLGSCLGGRGDLEKGILASGGLVLVVDSHTLKIVSSVCKRSELSDKGALFIEQIEKPRQPFPDLDVVYFLTPRSASLLLKDHPSEGCLYRFSHVFFTSALEAAEFNKLTSSAQFVSRCRNLVEFNLDFVSFEPDVFHCDAPLTLNSVFSNELNIDELLESHIDSLVSVFACLKEKPVIRFWDKSSTSKRVALGLRRKMDSLAKSSVAFKQSGTTVLVLDRSLETAGLWVHDFYYQALVLDVLDGLAPGVQWSLGNQTGDSAEQATSVVPSFTYTTTTGKGVEERRTVLLSEADPLWVKHRHDHFRVVSESITRELATLVRNGSGEPLEVLRGIPEYQDQIAKLSVHLELSQKLISVFEKLSLMPVARIEQELVTGLDDDGKDIGCTRIYNAILALMPTIAPEERLRLVMLYLSQVHDVSEITAKELAHSIANASFEQAVSKFLALGLHGTRIAAPEGVVAGATGARGSLITIPSNRHSLKMPKLKLKRNKSITRSSKFVNCRFQSELRDIVESTILNSLDGTNFPHVGGTGTSNYVPGGLSPDGPMQRSAAASMWGHAIQEEGRRQKLVVFVVGGFTLGETREMAELSAQFGVDVLLGGSTVLTPKRLVEILLS